MNELQPCPYRHASDDGQILCERIKVGDRAVSPNICRACPVAAINCAHLRTTLEHDVRPPITVRWGNGKTQVWESDAPSITMQHAACAARVIPIHSSRECTGCALRQPLTVAMAASEIVPVAKRAARKTAPAPQPAVAPSTAPVLPIVTTQTTPDARSKVVRQKIIQLQEWLRQNRSPTSPHENSVEESTVSTHAAVGGKRTRTEERRAGWTD